MKKSDISDLVVLAAGNDGREPSKTNVESWFAVFGADDWLTPELAREAVIRYYRAESRRIMAADILRVAAEIRAERLLETPMPDAVLDELAEVLHLPDAYRAVHDAAKAAIVARQDPVSAARLAGAEARRAIDGAPA